MAAFAERLWPPKKARAARVLPHLSFIIHDRSLPLKIYIYIYTEYTIFLIYRSLPTESLSFHLHIEGTRYPDPVKNYPWFAEKKPRYIRFKKVFAN